MSMGAFFYFVLCTYRKLLRLVLSKANFYQMGASSQNQSQQSLRSLNNNFFVLYLSRMCAVRYRALHNFLSFAAIINVFLLVFFFLLLSLLIPLLTERLAWQVISCFSPFLLPSIFHVSVNLSNPSFLIMGPKKFNFLFLILSIGVYV